MASKVATVKRNIFKLHIRYKAAIMILRSGYTFVNQKRLFECETAACLSRYLSKVVMYVVFPRRVRW